MLRTVGASQRRDATSQRSTTPFIFILKPAILKAHMENNTITSAEITKIIEGMLKAPGMYAQNPGSFEDQMHMLNNLRGTKDLFHKLYVQIQDDYSVPHCTVLTSNSTMDMALMANVMEQIENAILHPVAEEPVKKPVDTSDFTPATMSFTLYTGTKAFKQHPDLCIKSLREILEGYGALDLLDFRNSHSNTKGHTDFSVNLKANKELRVKLRRIFGTKDLRPTFIYNGNLIKDL